MKKEVFIERAIAIHGDKFDYSLLPDEFKTTDKVPILCPEHGRFEIESNSHTSRGSGCPKCGNIRKNSKSLETAKFKFFKDAPIIHNNKYDYSKAVYLSSKEPLIISCPTHGEFRQSPYNHLFGQGCKKCADQRNGVSQRLNTEDFINKSISVHGQKYNYFDTKYITQKDHVAIFCNEHGLFKMRAINHLNGQGCPKCGILVRTEKSRSSTIDFIEKSKLVHGTKYDYSKVEYTTSTSPVSIGCYIHGEFLQKPSHHLSGSGCKSCTVGGYNNQCSGTFYIINVNDTTIKFGISNNPKNRLKDLQKGCKFTLTFLHQFYFEDGNIPVHIEKDVKCTIPAKILSKDDMINGYTETTCKSNLSVILEIVDKYKPA